MGLLDQLWDDTLAGPRPSLWDDTLAGPCPENGLGKLRKTGSTISAMAPYSSPEAAEALSRLTEHRANAEFQPSNDEKKQVTHSITIIKPPGYSRSLSLDSPLSPAGSSPPMSPSSLTPRERENPWRSNKYGNNVPGAAKKGSERSPKEARSSTGYDWVLMRSGD